jgi:hypothetical protein
MGLPPMEVMVMSENPDLQAPHADPAEDPSELVTGDEPLTGAQHSYLQILAQEAKSEVPQGLTKAPKPPN